MRQETECSISYPATEESRGGHRNRLSSGIAPPTKETEPDRDRGRPLLGFEAYPEGAYLETSGVRIRAG